jgi:hypothetical protein
MAFDSVDAIAAGWQTSAAADASLCESDGAGTDEEESRKQDEIEKSSAGMFGCERHLDKLLLKGDLLSSSTGEE